MTEIEKRILLNQKEIMYALMSLSISSSSPITIKGLLEANNKTTEVLLAESLKSNNAKIRKEDV